MNKTLLTVAYIFAIITGVAYCLSIVGIPLGVFNFIAASKINAGKDGEESRETVRNWSIYLIFTTAIGGICGLIAATSDEDKKPTTIDETLEGRLGRLNKLYDDGVITKEEYGAQRKAIIEDVPTHE